MLVGVEIVNLKLLKTAKSIFHIGGFNDILI